MITPRPDPLSTYRLDLSRHAAGSGAVGEGRVLHCLRRPAPGRCLLPVLRIAGGRSAAGVRDDAADRSGRALEQRWNERSPRGARLAAVVAAMAARAERAAGETASRRAAAERRRVQLQAAGRVDRLLDASTTARRAVVAATQGLADCVLPADAAAAGLQRVSEMRRRLLDQLDVLDFSPLSHSRQIRSALTQAWSASLDADLSYLAWAQHQDVYGDCDTADGDYLDGNESSAQGSRGEEDLRFALEPVRGRAAAPVPTIGGRVCDRARHPPLLRRLSAAVSSDNSPSSTGHWQ